MLYIVATPIGNLEDITLRALSILKSVDLILAEDTRVTAKLLKHFEILTPMKSYHQHSSDSVKQEILGLLTQGKDIALVTDAGTPGISDPGNELIDYIFQHTTSRSSLLWGGALGDQPEAQRAESLSASDNFQISPISGASALATAISVSGFNMSKFVFLGFLPKKKRKKVFEWLKVGKISFAFFDSPYRVIKSLEEIKSEFGDEIRVFVARELTKLHESLYRGKIDEVIQSLKVGKVKGEVVVIIEL